jgi:hypothetical protein
MKSNNATSTAIAHGVKVVDGQTSAQEALWLFGESIVKAKVLAKKLNGTDRGVQTEIAEGVAMARGKEFTGIQSLVSRAVKCYNEFDSAKSAGAWTLRELVGKPKTAKKFDATVEAGKYAKNSKAERLALIKALQNIL